jgi:hypothetical protein
VAGTSTRFRTLAWPRRERETAPSPPREPCSCQCSVADRASSFILICGSTCLYVCKRSAQHPPTRIARLVPEGGGQ